MKLSTLVPVLGFLGGVFALASVLVHAGLMPGVDGPLYKRKCESKGSCWAAAVETCSSKGGKPALKALEYEATGSSIQPESKETMVFWLSVEFWCAR